MDDLLNSPPKLTRYLTLDGTKVILNPLAVRPSATPLPPSLHQREHSPLYSSPPKISLPTVEQTLTILPPDIIAEETCTEDEGRSVSSLAYEGTLVDQCIDNVLSLPQEVGEVAQKIKDLTLEINQQQEHLSKVKVQLQLARERHGETQEEVSAISRKICLVEDEVATKLKRTTQLQKDIDEMASDNSELTARVAVNKDRLQKEKRLYDAYREKMEKHVQMVADLESSYSINREGLSQLQKVEALREEKTKLESNPEEKEKVVNGTYEIKLQSEINGLQAKRIRMAKETSQRQEQLKSVKDRQGQVKQDIEILHKRNLAKLTRLKRQLKEAQVRNRQWNEEACLLEQNIAELRRQVEE